MVGGPDIRDFLEAGAGIEPAHSGFADHGVSTSPSGHSKYLQIIAVFLSKTPWTEPGGNMRSQKL